MARDGVTIQLVADGDLARRIASQPSGGAAAEEAELYRRFAPRVRLYGLKHLRRDDAAAQDLAQQVMLVTIQRLRGGEIRDPDRIGSFILSTSRMTANTLRRTDRRREVLIQQFDVPMEVNAEADVSLDLARMEQCLASLEDHARSVVILSFYAEKTSSEIATELGTTSGAVRVTRHRALGRLRSCLGLERKS